MIILNIHMTNARLPSSPLITRAHIIALILKPCCCWGKQLQPGEDEEGKCSAVDQSVESKHPHESVPP